MVLAGLGREKGGLVGAASGWFRARLHGVRSVSLDHVPWKQASLIGTSDHLPDSILVVLC